MVTRAQNVYKIKIGKAKLLIYAICAKNTNPFDHTGVRQIKFWPTIPIKWQSRLWFICPWRGTWEFPERSRKCLASSLSGPKCHTWSIINGLVKLWTGMGMGAWVSCALCQVKCKWPTNLPGYIAICKQNGYMLCLCTFICICVTAGQTGHKFPHNLCTKCGAEEETRRIPLPDHLFYSPSL